jgi:hypothetical protein
MQILFMQESDESRALKREIKMSRERKLKKNNICVWKWKRKEKKERKEEWQEIYEEGDSSER